MMTESETMEQKTEASQAVDEQVFLTIVYSVPRKHAAGFSAECTSSAHFSAASWSHALDDRDQARAALKAQPAPTEAPNFCASCGKRLHAGSIHTCTPPTQGEDSARLDAERDVLAERRRQVKVEGWAPARDDGYQFKEMAKAAICYIRGNRFVGSIDKPIDTWPWDHDWWKPTTYRRNLVKAGALILAEIERIDRARASAETGGVKS